LEEDWQTWETLNNGREREVSGSKKREKGVCPKKKGNATQRGEVIPKRGRKKPISSVQRLQN